jgi:UDP-N-acetylglucosamine:LPS N-acetylglucosamine transferase
MGNYDSVSSSSAYRIECMHTSTISIYFSDTGGGHRSAGYAVKAGLESVIKKEFPAAVGTRIIVEAMVEQVHVLTRYLIVIYNYLARHHPAGLKYYYWFLHMIHPESNLYYRLYRSSVHRILKSQQPSLIVSVHPMIAHTITRALQELDLSSSVKVVVVVTDPNNRLWRAWGCDRADLIIVPNDLVRNQLVNWRIPPEKIQVLGMPVHPEFLLPPVLEKTNFLQSLGLTPGVFTVCINASWAGNVHMLNVYKELRECRREIQVIFLSGYNKQLYAAATRAADKTGIPTVILPFYSQMSDLMNAVDVMVTKAGGLTTYEALARRLPLVLDKTIEPMTQEAVTLEILVRLGLAQELNQPRDIADCINKVQYPRTKNSALPEEYQVNLTDEGIFNIARSILSLSNSPISGDKSIQNVVEQPGKH